MDFYSYLQQYVNLDFSKFIESVTDVDVHRVLTKEDLTPLDYLTLLSPVAGNYLDSMAQKAQEVTIQNFGRVVSMFAPLYLANHCVNRCSYCSFNMENEIINRNVLSLREVEEEAGTLASTGIADILFLTGESRKVSPPEYMQDCVRILRRHFSNVSLEVYPLETREYAMLHQAGVDGFTMFQECYNEKRYAEVHLGGPKRNYRNRLDAPERACKAGIRSVTIGVLLGLYDFTSEAFFTGLHAYYLQRQYDAYDFAISLPRLRPSVGSSFKPYYDVTDRQIAQEMVALRLFLPRVGITVSTREAPALRDNLIGLGVTKMSAGSSTEVGGYASHTTEGQFDISDSRSVSEVTAAIRSKGWLPVFQDWRTLVGAKF